MHTFSCQPTEGEGGKGFYFSSLPSPPPAAPQEINPIDSASLPPEHTEVTLELQLFP